MALFEPVFAALDHAGARYVVVGGVATVLHGYARLTADLDLALDLSADQPARAIGALLGLGLVALLPVDPRGFADPMTRREWVEQRNLRVFSLHDPHDPLLVVDLFADPPIPFHELWARADRMRLGTTTVPVASIEDLIAMKRLAGRPRDLDDIEALLRLRDLRDER